MAAKKKTTNADLSASPWILREQGSGTREIFERAVTDRLGTLNVRYELGHTEAVKQAVKNDLGISCLSRLTVMEELKAGMLTELHTPFTNLQRYFYRLHHRGRYSTGPISYFTEFVDRQTSTT